MDLVDEVGRRRLVEDRGQQGVGRRRVEPSEVDAFDQTAPVELGQPRQERMAAVELVGAEGHDQDDPVAPELADQERDRFARRRVGPVEVLDDEEDGVDLRQALEDAEDGIEQARLDRLGLDGVATRPAGPSDGTSRARSSRAPPTTASSSSGSSVRASVRRASTIGPYGTPAVADVRAATDDDAHPAGRREGGPRSPGATCRRRPRLPRADGPGLRPRRRRAPGPWPRAPSRVPRASG